RRLGELGAVELLFRALLRELPQVDAGAFGGLGEGLAHLRVRRRQFGEHADGLGTLAGEAKGKRRLGHALSQFEEGRRCYGRNAPVVCTTADVQAAATAPGTARERCKAAANAAGTARKRGKAARWRPFRFAGRGARLSSAAAPSPR